MRCCTTHKWWMCSSSSSTAAWTFGHAEGKYVPGDSQHALMVAVAASPESTRGASHVSTNGTLACTSLTNQAAASRAGTREANATRQPAASAPGGRHKSMQSSFAAVMPITSSKRTHAYHTSSAVAVLSKGSCSVRIACSGLPPTLDSGVPSRRRARCSHAKARYVHRFLFDTRALSLLSFCDKAAQRARGIAAVSRRAAGNRNLASAATVAAVAVLSDPARIAAIGIELWPAKKVAYARCISSR
eukprot:7361665-Prymnesium_polylepis.2